LDQRHGAEVVGGDAHEQERRAPYRPQHDQFQRRDPVPHEVGVQRGNRGLHRIAGVAVHGSSSKSVGLGSTTSSVPWLPAATPCTVPAGTTNTSPASTGTGRPPTSSSIRPSSTNSASSWSWISAA